MYEDKTPEAIKAAIISAIETDLDTREGSFVNDMVGPMAVELFKLYGSLNAVQPMVWVDETSGPYLDMAAVDLGLEPRKAGTYAQVNLLVTGRAGHSVPAGTTFMTADGEYFDSTARRTVPDSGSVLIPAKAREIGGRFNVEADSIVLQYINNDRITAVTNPEPAIGGSDEESDASLYERIVRTRQKPSTSGNVYDYERWALEAPGVGSVKVYPLWDGPGTVKVLVAGERRQPLDEALVSACAEHIEQSRPIGAEVTVASVQALRVDVDATVRLEDGAVESEVRQALVDELERYFASLALEQTEIRYNRIGAILMGVDGILDYSSLTINGMEESIPLGDEEVPVAGEVVLTCA